ncbi:unnamed protein product [Gadus morhua 'NCC']
MFTETRPPHPPTKPQATASTGLLVSGRWGPAIRVHYFTHAVHDCTAPAPLLFPMTSSGSAAKVLTADHPTLPDSRPPPQRFHPHPSQPRPAPGAPGLAGGCGYRRGDGASGRRNPRRGKAFWRWRLPGVERGPRKSS